MSCISTCVTLETLSHQSAFKEKVFIPPARTDSASNSVPACPSVTSHRAPIPGSVVALPSQVLAPPSSLHLSA